MRGIILAGGHGTRLQPLTNTMSKQLLPVYDKPMIYYPLTTLMLAGIRDILVISTPRDVSLFEHALGDGSQWGVALSYAVQQQPGGVAEAFIVGASFIDGQRCCLVLGDNIFFGDRFADRLRAARKEEKGAAVFAYRVKDPERYGVLEFDAAGRVAGIHEKPRRPPSDWAVTGAYFYDETVVERARSLNRSARGELEITDLNRSYLLERRLHVEFLGRGFAWLDTGTHEALHEASSFIRIIELRQGLKVACPEEIAFNLGYIGAAEVEAGARRLGGAYGDYLMGLLRPPAREQGR